MAVCSVHRDLKKQTCPKGRRCKYLPVFITEEDARSYLVVKTVITEKVLLNRLRAVRTVAEKREVLALMVNETIADFLNGNYPNEHIQFKRLRGVIPDDAVEEGDDAVDDGENDAVEEGDDAVDDGENDAVEEAVVEEPEQAPMEEPEQAPILTQMEQARVTMELALKQAPEYARSAIEQVLIAIEHAIAVIEKGPSQLEGVSNADVGVADEQVAVKDGEGGGMGGDTDQVMSNLANEEAPMHWGREFLMMLDDGPPLLAEPGGSWWSGNKELFDAVASPSFGKAIQELDRKSGLDG